MTFLTSTESHELNKAIHNYDTSPMKQREAQPWLTNRKRNARNYIFDLFDEKVYIFSENYVRIFTKWQYNPFHFILVVKYKSQVLNLNIKDKPFDYKIPAFTLGEQTVQQEEVLRVVWERRETAIREPTKKERLLKKVKVKK